MPLRAVSFDAGQTLVELDTGMLAARLAERGVSVTADALAQALPIAWRHHEAAVAAGARHPWHELMRALLDAAGCGDRALVDPKGAASPPQWQSHWGPHPARLASLVEWLWDEQPRRNLWRRPVPGMRALVQELARDLPLVVISNSEGRLRELLVELGWAQHFVAIADSGALGVAKPDPGIFTWALARLGVAAADVVHVGDSREADVDGALAAGLRAAWFGPAARLRADDDPARVAACADAAALRDQLARWRGRARG